MTGDLDDLRARLKSAGYRWTLARVDHAARMADARQRIDSTRAARAELVDEVSAIAREATAAGLSESETAALLGVSRARTLRRWLGK